jgi:hypothetical protein
MSERSREDEALVAKSVAMIVGRLDDKLPEITRATQEFLVAEIPEIAGAGELQELVRDSVTGNFETFFPAIRHGIPIRAIEPATAALEHARRLAQRGVDADALVRTYRLGHLAFVKMVLDEIRAAHLDAQLGLDVFEQITSTSFRYVDRISQLVLTAYQNERDHWLTHQNRLRAVRVREVLDGAEIDVDKTAEAIGYPLRRIHLSMIVWCVESDTSNELAVMERFTGELHCSWRRIVSPDGRGYRWPKTLQPTRPGGFENSPTRGRTHRGSRPVLRFRASKGSAARTGKRSPPEPSYWRRDRTRRRSPRRLIRASWWPPNSALTWSTREHGSVTSWALSPRRPTATNGCAKLCGNFCAPGQVSKPPQMRCICTSTP